MGRMDDMGEELETMLAIAEEVMTTPKEELEAEDLNGGTKITEGFTITTDEVVE